MNMSGNEYCLHSCRVRTMVKLYGSKSVLRISPLQRSGTLSNLFVSSRYSTRCLRARSILSPIDCKNRPPHQRHLSEETLGNVLVLTDSDRTYADLSFVPWDHVLLSAPFFREAIWDEYDLAKKCPSFVAWHERLMARPSVKTVYGL
jgi:hypothetical protein